MTMPLPFDSSERSSLPDPNPDSPMLILVITNNIIPDDRHSKTIPWVASKPHPFVPGMHVVRMYDYPSEVHVYSVSDDGRTSMRDEIRLEDVRLRQRVMSIDVLISEIEEAEYGAEEDEEPEPEPEPEVPVIPMPSPNGQAAS